MRLKINRIAATISLFIGYCLLFTNKALAVCPICTLAVSAGVGLSQYLGIDDAISGIWIGSLTLSASFWLTDWLERKYKAKAERYKTLVYPVMYLLAIIPLWYTKMIGVPYNTIFGIDKLLLGIILGSIIFLLTVLADKKVREIKGKQLFNYQKVIFPVFSLGLISLILNFLIT